MWGGELFKAFRENNIRKEREISSKYLSRSSKRCLQSIKGVYKKRKKQGMTPFIAAILHNEVALCEQLIEEGIDFNQQGPAEMLDETKLTQFTNSVRKLTEMLDLNNKDFKDLKKTTPMFWAILCDKISLIDKLIQSGHKINSLVEKFTGMYAFSFAIMCGNIPVMKYFLQNPVCDIHENSLSNMKPLDLVLRWENEEMVRLLLEHGEKLNCTSHQLSPFLQAVFLKNLETVKLMLKMGADINFGMKNGNLFPPLHMAILHHNFEIASFLIEKGADVTVKDFTNDTALHLLLRHFETQAQTGLNQSDLKLAQLLLDKGAKVCVSNNKDEIPLARAILLGKPELVDLFLTIPVDLNTLLDLENKSTFLHIAVALFICRQYYSIEDRVAKDYWKNQIEIVQLLINKGSDVNTTTEDGTTSLHLAAESGCIPLVKMMLSSQADINKQSGNGKVALHFAARTGSLGVVQLLLQSGAEVNIKDNDGSTPIKYGILVESERMSFKITKLLIDYGADIYSCSWYNSHLKPYDLVATITRFDIMKLFWKEGYPYDFTICSPDIILKMMQSLFQSKETSPYNELQYEQCKINSKPFEELLTVQGMFIKGVEENSVNLVMNAIKKGAEIKVCSVKIPSPLHFLAKYGFTDVAKVLLNKGVKPNTVNGEGKIPTDLAVEFGHYRMYITLLQYGACYNYNRPGCDTSVLKKQRNNQHHELFKLIKEAFKYVKQGDLQIVENLNKYVMLKEWDVYHALVNCVDKKGRTLMALAVDRGHSVITQNLMTFRLQAPKIRAVHRD